MPAKHWILTGESLTKWMTHSDGIKTVLWMLCHYPNKRETEERVRTVVSLYHMCHWPIWVFGGYVANISDRIENIMKGSLVERGIPEFDVHCSIEFGEFEILDTTQEVDTVLSVAHKEGIRRLICVSNWLQLLQVQGLSRRLPLDILFVPSKLRDYRPWYLTVRFALTPLAFMGVDSRFWPLTYLRKARSLWAGWPF